MTVHALAALVEETQREAAARSTNYPTVTMQEAMQALEKFHGHALTEFRDGMLVEIKIPVYLKIRIR